jgi:hypothetical protein
MIRITSDFVVSLQLCITSFAIRVVQNNLTISANNAEQSGSLQTCAIFVFVYNIFPHAIRGFAVWRAFLLKGTDYWQHIAFTSLCSQLETIDCRLQKVENSIWVHCKPGNARRFLYMFSDHQIIRLRIVYWMIFCILIYWSMGFFLGGGCD